MPRKERKPVIVGFRKYDPEPIHLYCPVHRNLRLVRINDMLLCSAGCGPVIPATRIVDTIE